MKLLNYNCDKAIISKKNLKYCWDNSAYELCNKNLETRSKAKSYMASFKDKNGNYTNNGVDAMNA